ncbi:hypothetical protein BDY21DRAFT_342929 [Lineolata rhizophorae]|uniref:Actin-like ATPase domain-containing protein n=1 Tax=Lineolata rhizophorae TaxID=578093 RepID=A0A6A6P221_9PEZI|nr:hypothetical protein BDY21DRAFT_342929 [Lineolata rhizophorae]
MPAFKDDQIIIISPGSRTTLAQLGLPESFTPAKLRFKSRMFPAEKDGEWEPFKVRRRGKPAANGDAPPADPQPVAEDGEDGVQYEEDIHSDEGAIWPIEEGRITDWPCFFALMTYVYNTMNPPFHTPILLVAQPAWTSREREKLTQFFFEKFKTPAFGLLDSAVAALYAFGTMTATVVDVGFEKADVTAISDFLVHEHGRTVALPRCGGEAMTERLYEMLKGRGFTPEMCEQLKTSPICEVLPLGVDLPLVGEGEREAPANPAAAASTGANASGPGHRNSAGAMGDAPRGPGPDTDVGEEQKEDDDNEGVLDVASIVTGGKMNEYLARKEKEKAEKAVARRKGAQEAATNAPKAARLPNSKRPRNTFIYEDYALHSALKDMNLSGQKMAEMQAALSDAPQQKQRTADENGDSAMIVDGYSSTEHGIPRDGPIRREIEVGIERFQAATGGILENLADAIHRTISSVEEVNKRSELWDGLIIVGNGAKIRGFKEALLATLNSKYIISPSSATIFTSELPSNLTTPSGTGTNTPQPQAPPHAAGGSNVNPLLFAATTSQNPHLNPGSQIQPMHTHNTHSSHGQTPTSIKTAKIPEYFPEWKEAGFDEATFLGAQVAAKVFFVVDQSGSKAYMTRTDYNDQGPSGIHEFSV